ncbi:MAG TPA: antibiotic biosynthesis monooxygenase [Polyangiales bacterium]|jgi:autoinducer 2-degrading protein|nr:antibiotic biosynthesis monooxygenase [Polyangiales bacterium]
MSAPLLVVHVHVHVKSDTVETFIAATLENCRASIQEPGIARFDFVQSNEDPSRFVLVEAYKTADAPDAHKRTAHYAKWRDTVADMLAEPRSSTKFHDLFPPREEW